MSEFASPADLDATIADLDLVDEPSGANVETVRVYTRHKKTCPKHGQPNWGRCNCMKWLYVYRDGKPQRISTKTRSWEKAEQKARGMRDSFDPTKQLQRQLTAKLNGHRRTEVAVAIEEFNKEVARLERADATRAKYKLTLSRLLEWCQAQNPPCVHLSQLDVPTLRSWISSWPGAATTRHNQHQRVRAFFRFCVDQEWVRDNPAKKIKNVSPQQEETLPFSREQYDALIKATSQYDSRCKKTAGDTVNSCRLRTYLKLLRWSGLRAGDAACLPKNKLRKDDSLFLYQAKVKGKASAPVYVLLPHDVAEELRNVPPTACTHPDYFFWSARSKRKSEVSNWEKTFAKVLEKAREMFPKLFYETDGETKPAHLHMLRDTFAVEYLLAGMSLEEVSRLLGHSSVTITQRHYAPWVLERQQRLAANQRVAWANMSFASELRE